MLDCNTRYVDDIFKAAKCLRCGLDRISQLGFIGHIDGGRENLERLARAYQPTPS